MSSSIHIFNPDTDYALASGRNNYSPPSSIVGIRKKMALFPATYAKDGDAIILLDKISSRELSDCIGYNDCRRKNIRILTLNDLKNYLSYHSKHSELILQPWGWNHTFVNTLRKMEIPEHYLKSDSAIDALRQLSHRRTCMPFRRVISLQLPQLSIDQSAEFINENDAFDFSMDHPIVYFKAPWSSSGRGIVNSVDLTGEGLKQWLRGCIRRQGSVIGEIGRKRTGDFATEWMCKDGKALFLGLSCFNATGDGHYLGNMNISQEEIDLKLGELSFQWNNEILKAQEEALDKLIAPNYDGPVGIDMFTTVEGELNPCVELNLRMTMGIATLWKN